MAQPIRALAPSERLLCGPGPTNVEPAALDAMAKPMLGHLDPELHAILDEVVAMLREVYRAAGRAGAPAAEHRARPAWRRGSPTWSSRATPWWWRGPATSAPASPRSPAATAPASSRSRRTGACTSPTSCCSTRSRATRARASWRSSTARPPPASSTRSPSSAQALRDSDTLLMADCVTTLGGVRAGLRRLGRRLRLLLHPEVPRGAARHVPDRRVGARARTDPRPLRAGAVRARPRAAARVLDRPPGRVPPHRADPARLRPPRGAAADAGGGRRGALAPPRAAPAVASPSAPRRQGSRCSPSRAIGSRR